MVWKRQTLIRIAASLAVGLLLCNSLVAVAAPIPVPVISSSRSGNFIAYSQDRNLRNQMLRVADGVMPEWEKIFQPPSEAPSPVILNDKTASLTPKGEGPVVTLIFETELGMKVQVDLYDVAALRSGAFEAGIVTALAMQAMHTNQPLRAGKALAMPPGWFVEGLVEEMRRSREGVADGLYSALIESGRPPDLTAFFQQKPAILDAASIIVYRAQAVSLLRVLKKSQESKKGFAALLSDSAFTTDREAPLMAAFPSVGGRSGLSKLWTLDIARASMPPRIASLTVEQSDRELEQILSSIGGPERISGTACSRGGAYLLRECSVRLFNLEFRAHPLFQPVLRDYRDMATQLARKPKASVTKRIEKLEGLRKFPTGRAREMTDYLNWFEVVRLDDSEKPNQDFLKESNSTSFKQSLFAVSRQHRSARMVNHANAPDFCKNGIETGLSHW
jgi:hypothetical protein